MPPNLNSPWSLWNDDWFLAMGRGSGFVDGSWLGEEQKATDQLEEKDDALLEEEEQKATDQPEEEEQKATDQPEEEEDSLLEEKQKATDQLEVVRLRMCVEGGILE